MAAHEGASAATLPEASPGPVRALVRTLSTRNVRFSPYLLLSLGVLLWACGVVAQHTWTNDFLLHVGTVRAMARDPLHPPDPMVGTGFGSPYYSPLILLLALVVRLGGLSPLAVFGGLALVNAVLLLWSFRRFCGWFTSSSGATIALVATLFLWGVNPPVWSGFLSMRSLAEVLPYPSTFAFGLMLLAWDRLLRYQARHEPRHLVSFGLLAATITLVHSFTAVSTAIGVVAILIAHWSAWRRRDLVGLALAGLGAFLLVAVWSVWYPCCSGCAGTGETCSYSYSGSPRPSWYSGSSPRSTSSCGRSRWRCSPCTWPSARSSRMRALSVSSGAAWLPSVRSSSYWRDWPST
jgi:hypothetical protein